MDNTITSEGSSGGGSTDVQMTIRHVHDELLQLLQQRAEVMRRIGAAKRTIVGLSALFGEGALDDNLRTLVGKGTERRQPGLTNMCRTVLMESDQMMSAHDVLDGICAQNPSLLAGHKNPVASLTTVLNRLVSYGEARRVLSSNNRRAWQWAAESEGSDSSKNASYLRSWRGRRS